MQPTTTQQNCTAQPAGALLSDIHDDVRAALKELAVVRERFDAAFADGATTAADYAEGSQALARALRALKNIKIGTRGAS